MSHSEKCPICQGTGRLPNDGKTSDATDKICHGLGWITVYDKMFPDYPIVPSELLPENQPYNDPCAGCSNSPKNNPNASGFCCCSLPYMNRPTL